MSNTISIAPEKLKCQECGFESEIPRKTFDGKFTKRKCESRVCQGKITRHALMIISPALTKEKAANRKRHVELADEKFIGEKFGKFSNANIGEKIVSLAPFPAHRRD